jgi:DNA mismatch endonuclease (patch repair protein)
VNGWYWPAKIARNRRRDMQTTDELELAGWRVVRVWEHQGIDEAVRLVEAVLSPSGGDFAVDESNFGR